MIWFWDVLTGKWILVDKVNTRTTKASLFDEKQEGAWNGPVRELMESGFCSTGKLGFQGRYWAKEHPCTCGCTIYTEGLPKCRKWLLVMTFAVSS